MKKFGLVLVAGLTACMRGAPAPVAPVQVPAVTAGAQPPLSVAVVDSPATPTIPTAPAPSLDTSRTGRIQADSSRAEADFLDTLKTASSDTATTSAVVSVAPSEVRTEAEALLGRPEEEAARITWDIDVETQASHSRVQYWMTFFTGRARWHFERYLERQTRYDSMIRTRLEAAGLPRDMIYLAMIESGFNQNARSRAGAVGLWQFMPETGRRYGLQFDSWVDDRRDPSLATDAAIRFLSELNNRFGSLWLAAAAYNGGPGRVSRGLARGDFGALNGDAVYFAMTEAGGAYFRPETRDYVPKLIAAALIGKEPARYGFTNLNHWTSLRFDSIEVADAIGLDVVARLSGAAISDIEELNARFYRGVTPPGRSVWVRVPSGTADSVAARIARVPARDRVTLVWHTVVRGETLSRIARRYAVSVNDIRSANRLRSTTLGSGQRLLIPTTARGVRGAAAAEPRRSTAAAARTTTAARTTAAQTTTAARTHVVAPGESLWSISQARGISLDEFDAGEQSDAAQRDPAGTAIAVTVAR